MYINPYYWVDDHPLLYGNIGSLDPGSYDHAHRWNFSNHQSPGGILLRNSRNFGMNNLNGHVSVTKQIIRSQDIPGPSKGCQMVAKGCQTTIH